MSADKLSAIEAAIKASKLGGYMAKWEDAIEAAILAYLETLAGDEGTVCAVEDILRGPYGGINMQARAVLSTLLQRAKGDRA
jgi:hypothetical protein